jgi:tetratricopeptide (TPR) repeat protein
MQSPSRITLLAGVLAVAGACAQPDAGETDEQQALASAEIMEIPITTANEAAMVDFLAGQERADVGRAVEANSLFRAAVEKDPTFAYAYLNIAYNSTSAEEFNSNVELAMENITNASDAERLMIEVGGAFTDSDNDKALEISKQLTEAYPNTPRAWLNLGNTYGGRQETDASRAAYQKALGLDPNMYAAHQAIGLSYLFSEPKDFAKAKEHFDHTVQLQPEEAKGYEFLGDTYRAMGELETARASYAAALEKDPGLGVVSNKKGHINYFLGSFAEARADYDAAIAYAEGPSSAASYGVYRAFVNLHAGSPGEAIAELAAVAETAGEKGLREDQAVGVQIFALSSAAQIALHHEIFDALKQILTAREAAQRTNIELVSDPDFTNGTEANIVLWRARSAARMGEIEKAQGLLEEHKTLLAEVRSPTRYQGLHQALGEIALKQGSFDEAAQHLREANLNNIYVNYLLALAEEGMGNAEEAKRLFTKVANFNFNSVGFALTRRDAIAKAEATT